MKTTGNYGLKKPEGSDVVNIDDLNYNSDVIDRKLKEVEKKASSIKVPVTSVNGKTGDVVLTADDIKVEGSKTVKSQFNDMKKEISKDIEIVRNNKVDKVTGKGLSTEDYTKAEKQKLEGIASRAEVNQNALSTININGRSVSASNKTDMLKLVLDNDLDVNIVNKEIHIQKRIAKNTLELYVNPSVSKNTSDETKPFKNLQDALDYIKDYYYSLEEGCRIWVKPGEYKQHVIIKNFDSKYKEIRIESEGSDAIPERGSISPHEKFVIMQQLDITNNSALILFVGFGFTCIDPKTMQIGTADVGGTYVRHLEILTNLNIIFVKCKFYGLIGNKQNYRYYYGIRSFYSTILVRDSVLGGFTNGTTKNGNASPIRVADNSNITLQYNMFRDNASYDIISENATVKIRKCTEYTGKTLKINRDNVSDVRQG